VKNMKKYDHTTEEFKLGHRHGWEHTPKVNNLRGNKDYAAGRTIGANDGHITEKILKEHQKPEWKEK
jgi:hypothetical protein